MQILARVGRLVIMVIFFVGIFLVERSWGQATPSGKACQQLRELREAFQDCWRKEFLRLAQWRGVNAALSSLAYIKDTNLAVASECHVYAHAIGEVAYQRWEQKKLGRVTADTSLCNFGYFHGLMQEYVSHRKNLAAAREMCDRESGAHPAILNRERAPQCFHGIGHGLVFGYAVEGDPDEVRLVAKAVADCDRLVPQLDTRRAECFNGVFGGIAALYFTLHGFSLRMRADDPFWLCRLQPEQLQKYCFDELVPPLFQMVNYDLVAAARFIGVIENWQIRDLAMEHLGWMPTHLGLLLKENYQEVIDACRLVGNSLSAACLRGLTKSLVGFGKPTDAVLRATSFCDTYRGVEKEHADCYAAIGEQIRFGYSNWEQREVCGKFHRQLPNLCGELQ